MSKAVLALTLLVLAFGLAVSVARAADTPAAGNLKGKRVAILATDGFEQSELLEPRKALDLAGAKTVVVSPKSGQIRAWNSSDWGVPVAVDATLDEAKPDQFDALLLPGGVMNPDKLRMDEHAVKFVKAFFEAGKPIAAICHGPWTLVEAGAADLALAIVAAFGELLDHLAVECWDISRFAAGDDPLIVHHFLIDPVCASVLEVGLDRFI